MGGFGSGSGERPSIAKRPTLRTLHRLDIRWLQRRGYLDGTSHCLPWVQGGRLDLLDLCRVGETLVFDWPGDGPVATENRWSIALRLSTSRCHFGGERLWVHCARCGRRAAVLYGSFLMLRCHRCSRYPYASQCRTAEDRLYQQVWKLRKRLGASRNLSEPISPATKPKRMHWRTWERLRAQEHKVRERILALYNVSLAAMRRPL